MLYEYSALLPGRLGGYTAAADQINTQLIILLHIMRHDLLAVLA